MSVPDLTSPAPGESLPPQIEESVLRFLSRRRSASAVTLVEPGPDQATIDLLLQLAVRAPDHGKLTPWRFIILQGDGKAAFAAGLETIAQKRGDVRSAAKLIKLKTPPLGIAVVSRLHEGDIPEWEQRLSAAAVCTNLLYAALASGLGANWITDWYAYDHEALTLLGLQQGEQLAGFIFIGTCAEAPLERPRPDASALTSLWTAKI